MIGRLIRNTDPNQKWVSRNPLTSGPNDPATRWWRPDRDRLGPLPGREMFTRIDSVDGMMNAAPTPISARQPMICDISVACDAPAAATKKVASPTAVRPCGRSDRRARRRRRATRRRRASTTRRPTGIATRSRRSRARAREARRSGSSSRRRRSGDSGRARPRPPATVVRCSQRGCGAWRWGERSRGWRWGYYDSL